MLPRLVPVVGEVEEDVHHHLGRVRVRGRVRDRDRDRVGVRVRVRAWPGLGLGLGLGLDVHHDVEDVEESVTQHPPLPG